MPRGSLHAVTDWSGWVPLPHGATQLSELLEGPVEALIVTTQHSASPPAQPCASHTLRATPCSQTSTFWEPDLRGSRSPDSGGVSEHSLFWALRVDEGPAAPRSHAAPSCLSPGSLTPEKRRSSINGGLSPPKASSSQHPPHRSPETVSSPPTDGRGRVHPADTSHADPFSPSGILKGNPEGKELLRTGGGMGGITTRAETQTMQWTRRPRDHRGSE